MEWLAFITAIFEMIEKCREENQSEERIVRRIRRFGPFVQWRTRKALRKQGLRGQELNDRVAEVRDEVDEMTDEELVEFIKEGPGDDE